MIGQYTLDSRANSIRDTGLSLSYIGPIFRSSPNVSSSFFSYTSFIGLSPRLGCCFCFFRSPCLHTCKLAFSVLLPYRRYPFVIYLPSFITICALSFQYLDIKTRRTHPFDRPKHVRLPISLWSPPLIIHAKLSTGLTVQKTFGNKCVSGFSYSGISPYGHLTSKVTSPLRSP